MNTFQAYAIMVITRPESGRLSRLLNNPGVYFELAGEDFVTGFGFGVGQSDWEKKVSLLTKIITCLSGTQSDDIASLDGKKIRVNLGGGVQIVALGWIDAPSIVPENVAPFIDEEGWFYTERFETFCRA